MQFILILISYLLFYNFSISKDTKEIISKTHSKTEVKTFNLKNGINFSSYISEESWENNLGNYGINKCLGTVKKMPSNEIKLNIMCESTDKNGYKTWSVLKRSSSNIESGVRYAEIVDSNVPHKKLWIGTKCTCATNYIEVVNFIIQKCSASDKLYEKFLKLVNK